MRVLRVITATFFASLMAAGVAFAADDPLEIHGGGRVGIDVNGQGGAGNSTLISNEAGSMPNYGQSRYWALSISKKVKSDDGSWAKVATTIDNWTGTVATDLTAINFRFREAQVQFGGLDFLPADAVLWGGLRGYGAGWDGQQDHGFIDFNGIGFGVEKLVAGVLSLAYMKEDSQVFTAGAKATLTTPLVEEVNGANTEGLGTRTLHNFIANVNVPLADVYAAFGYSPKGSAAGEKNLTDFYLGGIFHAPVAGLNIGAEYSTNGYAFEAYNGNSDTVLKGDHLSGFDADKTQKYTSIAGIAWSVTDIMPGLYICPALRYEILTAGKETSVAIHSKDTTFTKIGGSFRISKAITKNISFVPTLGYYRESNDSSGAKALQEFQETLALEVALNQGFGANQKLQFYGTATECDKDHKGTKEGVLNADGTRSYGALGAAYGGKTLALTFGLLVTFGF